MAIIDAEERKKIVETIKEEYKKQEARYLRDKTYLRHTLGGYFAGSAVDDLFHLFSLLGLSRCRNFIDLGSGDGRAVFVAGLFTQASGIELDPDLFSISKMMQERISVPVLFTQADFLDADLSQSDVIFINPDTHFYVLEKKLDREMQPGSMLIVYNAVYKPLNMRLINEIQLKGSKALVYGR